MPIKKQKSVRKTKVIEEVQLNFRVVKPKSEDENQQDNEAFYPSASASDNEEEKDEQKVDEKKDEEVKQSQDDEKAKDADEK